MVLADTREQPVRAVGTHGAVGLDVLALHGDRFGQDCVEALASRSATRSTHTVRFTAVGRAARTRAISACSRATSQFSRSLCISAGRRHRSRRRRWRGPRGRRDAGSRARSSARLAHSPHFSILECFMVWAERHQLPQT